MVWSRPCGCDGGKAPHFQAWTGHRSDAGVADEAAPRQREQQQGITARILRLGHQVDAIRARVVDQYRQANQIFRQSQHDRSPSRRASSAHHAHVGAWVELGAALPHDDVARNAALPAKQLHAQVLGVGVLGVLRGAALLLGRKAQLLPLRAAACRCTAPAAARLGGRRCGPHCAACRVYR